eukprot:g6965.t1 g6965   contig23:1583216-1587175(+)
MLPRPASPLFPDEEFGQDYDDTTSIVEEDNASMVASSNGDSKPEFRLCTPQKHQQSSPVAEESPLHSLPQRPICPFPEEADRKRIVGCLAAILASSYGYETVPHLLVKKMAVGKGVPISVNRLVPTENDTFALEGHTAIKDAEKGTKSSIGEKGCNSEGQQKEPKPPIPIQTNRPPSLSQSVPNNVNQRSVISPHSTSEIQTTKPPLPSRPKLSLQNSFSFSSFNSNKNPFDKSGTQTPPPNLSAELAEIRHRIRRHAILSDVLVSSADMLMLDPSHARAFLPMLEGLLSKVEDPTTNGMQNGGGNNATPVAGKRESWKGRGFGGGGMPDTNGYHSYHGASSTAATMYSTAMNSSASSICNSPSVPDLRMSEKVAIAKEEAKPPPSTATIQKCPEQMEIKKSPSSQKESPSDVDFYSPLDTVIVDKELVAPFLQTLTPGAGFRCIALLLLNHLLRDGRGYDARVRHAFKRLSVVILSHELKVGGILRVDLEDEDDLDVLLWGERERSKSDDLEDYDDAEELARLATRKFEAMEHAIAAKLISMSGQGSGTTPTTKASQKQSQPNRVSQRQLANDARSSSSSSSNVSHGRIALAPKDTPISAQHGLSKEQLLRGLKIGTAGAVGATLFALTGGLAAPGIAAGLAAVAGGSAVAAGVSTVLTSAAAISTIFGVGGAGLAGYKMHRRTKGLTEFDFQKEGMSKNGEAELFSTVCISGWLRDARDFQRPWGVFPSHPRIVDKLELLERFYFIHNPENVQRCQEILKHWKGRYFQLWRALREKYGTDPSNLFPLKEGPRISAELTHEEGEAVDFLLEELGYAPNKSSPKKSVDRSRKKLTPRPRASPPETLKMQSAMKDSSLKPQKGLLETFGMSSPDISSLSTNLSLFSEESEARAECDKSNPGDESTAASTKSSSTKPSADSTGKAPPKHLLTVWDYHANYGGELYTVRWEGELLMELCDSVTDQMIQWGIGTTKTILHTTAFATLMTAVTLPYSLIMAADVIDDSWAMAMERADRAGVELAKSLIDSTAGHRPVVLVGFSMGARVIYSALKELTKHQELWEAQQQKKQFKRQNSQEETLQYIREPASIIEDAILMGLPNHLSLKSWEACRRIVAGRLINCYSRKDLILSLMFQLKRMQGILRPVCGTSPVAVTGVENYDVTDLVSAHTDYCLVTGEILKRVRHGQPQRASSSPKTEVDAMVTTINVANFINTSSTTERSIGGGFASLADEAAVPRRKS